MNWLKLSEIRSYLNLFNQNRSLLSHAVDRHNKFNAAKKIANNHDLIKYENKDNSVSEERDLNLQVTKSCFISWYFLLFIYVFIIIVVVVVLIIFYYRVDTNIHIPIHFLCSHFGTITTLVFINFLFLLFTMLIFLLQCLKR